MQHGLKHGLMTKKEQVDFLQSHIATMLVGDNKNFGITASKILALQKI